MRVHPLDNLAVQLEHEAQNAMRRRMFRAEVDCEGSLRRRQCGFGHDTPRMANGEWRIG